MRRLAAAGLLLAAAGHGLAEGVIRVPGDHPTISAALAAAPPHAVVEVTAGDYPESLLIERPVTLRAAAGAEVTLTAPADAATIEIRGTHDVSVHGLTVVGGKFGIFVTRSRGVTLEDNLVSGSRLVGIRVRLASAAIVNNTVVATAAPYGKGIHVTNTTQWPPSRVVGNTVAGNATSGIVTNMALGIRIEDNTVTGNRRHGVAITEMSQAVVAANRVDRNGANGIYVDDMSVARVCDNVVTGTVAAERSGVHHGNGILVDFHSRAELVNNRISDNENHGIQALFHSRVVATANQVWGNGVEVSDAIELGGASGDHACR